MNFREHVRRESAVGFTAYQITTLAEAMTKATAIVFIYTSWSGPAVYSWRILSRTLVDLGASPSVLVVDADGFTTALALELLDRLPQGKGETYWIKDGQLTTMTAGYREDDVPMLMDHCKRLLQS